MNDGFVANESGNIKISEEVISTIASLAVREVEGVSSLSAHGGGWSEILSKKNAGRGIKVELTEDGAVIDLHITVQYGVKIQDVAKTLQAQVKNSVETMTGLAGLTINVHIDGVEIDKETANEENKPEEK